MSNVSGIVAEAFEFIAQLGRDFLSYDGLPVLYYISVRSKNINKAFGSTKLGTKEGREPNLSLLGKREKHIAYVIFGGAGCGSTFKNKTYRPCLEPLSSSS